MSDILNTKINYNQMKCSASGIRFFDASGTRYVGLRPVSEDLEETYDLVFPRRKGVSGEAMVWDGSGNLEWTPSIGDKGDTGSKGDIGNKGTDGNTALNLWHENWTIPSEKTDNIVTVTDASNGYIYFQAFSPETTGEYTNIKFRCFTSSNDGLPGNLNNSKIVAGIYTNGGDPPPGATPWPDDGPGGSGGPGLPWPNIKW